jgi:hypothetical protein
MSEREIDYSSLAGLDGGRRNIAKFKLEWKHLQIEMKPHYKEFREHPGPHKFINLMTESRRCVPYLMAHIDFARYLVLVAIIAVLAGR